MSVFSFYTKVSIFIVIIHKLYLVPVYHWFGPSYEYSQETIFQKCLCNDKIYEVPDIKKKQTQKYDKKIVIRLFTQLIIKTKTFFVLTVAEHCPR